MKNLPINKNKNRLNTMVKFEIKSNCCVTRCDYFNINVGSVTCKECKFYQGEVGLYVKCSYPQKESKSTKEKK